MQAVEATGLELWQMLEAEILHFPSAFCMFSGIPNLFFNKVMVKNELSDDEFKKIFDFAEGKNLPYSWIVPQEISLDLLKTHKFLPATSMTCMVKELQNSGLQPTEGPLRIEKVETMQALEDNLAIWKESFSVSQTAYRMQFERLKHHFQNKCSPLHFFLGYFEETAVACGWLLLGNEYAGIYNIGTKACFRNRGAATTMMQRLVAEAKTRGYKRAVLTALPAAKSIYEKLGFETYKEFVLYGKCETGST